MNKKLNNIFNLDEKIVVITGASGLLGVRHAEVIASFGGTPILLDLSERAVIDLADMIRDKFKVEAKGFKVDITDESQVNTNALKLIEMYGKVDGLINNASNNPKMESGSTENFSRLEKFPLDLWNQDILVGLTGAFICAKYYGNLISKNPNGGSIVNISSDLGLIAPDQRLYANSKLKESEQPVKPVTYSVIKAGIIGLTRYLATYWPDKNVRCNAICPGGVENGQSIDFLNAVSSRIPLNRLAKPDEYQSTLIWMLSDASSYLNGSIIAVDGGRSSW